MEQASKQACKHKSIGADNLSIQIPRKVQLAGEKQQQQQQNRISIGIN